MYHKKKPRNSFFEDFFHKLAKFHLKIEIFTKKSSKPI